MEIRTPLLTHAGVDAWNCVYEPSEDSFLLIDALELDLEKIMRRKPVICLEIGSGSGIIITALGQTLKTGVFFASDINMKACELTKRTGEENGIGLEVIRADLSPLKDGAVDLVVFNPPYVPTENVEGFGIERSWAGGIRGRQIIDKFLENVVPKLSEKAMGYLLLLEENDPEEIEEILKGLKYSVDRIAHRQIRGESLLVLRFEKN